LYVVAAGVCLFLQLPIFSARVSVKHQSVHVPRLAAAAAGGVTSFKATDKKVVNKNPQQNQDQGDSTNSSSSDGEALPWHRMRNLGDMEGTWDGWVLLLSFSLSFITAIVGVFQMIDKPYTAQVGVAQCWRLCLPGDKKRQNTESVSCLQALVVVAWVKLLLNRWSVPVHMLGALLRSLPPPHAAPVLTLTPTLTLAHTLIVSHTHRVSSAGSWHCPSSGPSTT
jgi:hypothetical protein